MQERTQSLAEQNRKLEADLRKMSALVEKMSAELEALLKVVAAHNIYLIVDEIYDVLVYTGPYTSVLSLIKDRPALRERTIVVNGFSKAFSMTGWRLGYAAGPREIGGGIASAGVAGFRLASPGYFAAVGVPLLAGRDFNERDLYDAEPVVIVNRAFAGRYLGPSPLGARLPMGVGHGGEARRPRRCLGFVERNGGNHAGAVENLASADTRGTGAIDLAVDAPDALRACGAGVPSARCAGFGAGDAHVGWLNLMT